MKNAMEFSLQETEALVLQARNMDQISPEDFLKVAVALADLRHFVLQHQIQLKEYQLQQVLRGMRQAETLSDRKQRSLDDDALLTCVLVVDA